MKKKVNNELGYYDFIIDFTDTIISNKIDIIQKRIIFDLTHIPFQYDELILHMKNIKNKKIKKMKLPNNKKIFALEFSEDDFINPGLYLFWLEADKNPIKAFFIQIMEEK